jgi:hypothetical protein
MASDALDDWRTDRITRLQYVEADCLHLHGLHAADPSRVQGHIRSFAVLLSSEFQGFCRDLHSECADRLVDAVSPPGLRTVLRSQCFYGRKLDTGNPHPANLGADFNRYNIAFWDAVDALDPVNHPARRRRLARLNAWRNAITHHDYDPGELGGTTTLTVSEVQDWRADCDALAAAFDAVLRDHLEAVTGVPPWPP